MSAIRVRIAPSPTGNLHVGTARTALFNYLFAKRHNGTFVLRIEDTDLERSRNEYVQNIFDSLKALGLTWDEGPDCGGPYGPYRQMERTELYQRYAQRLLDEGKAYYCYLTQEELDAMKQQAIEDKRPVSYIRPNHTPEQIEAFKQDPSRKPTIRFAVPTHIDKVSWVDAVRGEVTFDTAVIEDFVLMKSNGTPSYNFAVVVDDIEMKISHVIRGEDHVSNTPKQILIFQALGAALPEFAHVGMILAPDRSKLSKRHGATAVSEFIEQQGYLPEAFCNFITLLGWSPPDGEEVGTLERFASAFSLDRITKSPAVFDREKLDWLNGLYIRQLEMDDLIQRAQPFLSDFDLSIFDTSQLRMLLEAARERLTTLSELKDWVGYFFGEDVSYDSEICKDVLHQTDTETVLGRFEQEALPAIDWTSPETIGASVKTFAETLKPMKMKTIMWAIRAATTGRVHGLDLGLTLYLLGQRRVQHRVHQALGVIAAKVS